MSNPAHTKIALETWDLCNQLLPNECGWTVAPHPKDPSLLQKKGHAPFVTQLRILPEPKQPVRFWSSSWCFYQILVGPADAGTNLGGIQFLQFSGQDACGGGLWRKPVAAILRELQTRRPAEFSITELNDKGAIKPQLCTRYRMSSQCKTFPVEQAAADLAWLIQESLPRFQALRLGAISVRAGADTQIWHGLLDPQPTQRTCQCGGASSCRDLGRPSG
jgi:hypothetical protein